MNNIIKIGVLSVVFLASITAQATNKIKTKNSIDKTIEDSITTVGRGEILSIIEVAEGVLFQGNLKKTNWSHKALDFSKVSAIIDLIEYGHGNKTAKVLIHDLGKSKGVLPIYDIDEVEINGTNNEKLVTYSVFDLLNLPLGKYTGVTRIC